ncbi:hypothetical protein PV328_009960 [Microctonus aethiopoides]|uniref:Transforming acidic coiled-coil-containing protein C-terminal domain-containing protein n=1 Tax=Microctonus aethiopoides TaxID=144406 RepID=A0AA39F158_9HYME|nr:hypothetical protein PV328_009960 [Microctonus aethiopoides]
MSSPTKINSSPMGAREGQRVILREITKSIHNSPPSMNISDVISKVSPEHEVKVKFTREFGDVVNYPPSINAEANNISSASSFQSLTSTLSTKSSSDINVAEPITKISDTFNSNSDVSDLDDLISACAAIHLNDTTVVTGEQSFTDATFASATDEINKISHLSGSRSNSPCPDINSTQIISSDLNLNASEIIYERLNPDFNSTQQISPQVIKNNNHQDSYVKALTEQNISPDYATANESLLQSVSLLDDVENNDKNVNNTFAVPLPPQDFIPLTESSSTAVEVEIIKTKNSTEKDSDIPSKFSSSPSSILLREESQVQVECENSHCDSSQTPVDTFSITPVENSSYENVLQSFPDISTSCLTAIKEPTFIETQNLLETNASRLPEPTAQSIVVKPEISNEDCVISVKQVEQEQNELSTEVLTNQQINNINNQLDNSGTVDVNQIHTEATSIDVLTEANLDVTVDIHDISNNSLDAIEAENYKDIALEELNPNIETVAKINSEIIPQKHEDYDNFLPPRQSTSLNDLLSSNLNTELSAINNSAINEPEFFDAHNTLTTDCQIDFEKLKLAEKNIINDFNNTSLDLVNDQEHITNTSTDLWRDPTNFDFLFSKKSNSATTDRLRAESLYVKFDPLVSNISMLPQGNGATATPNEERNGEKEASMPNIGTPKRNSAIAAIDRLLFYSPMTPANQKSEEPKKIEPTEKTTPEPIPIVDPVMAKELEIVRATVIQLEEQLEKQKLINDQQEKEHKVDREAFQEAITQLQKQLNQEIKSKNQINVVVDEYEKSISRLVAERERDRKNLDVEKASLLEELQEVKNHLSASEAAFNDVHAKYERLKVVVTASKNNEAALKASIAENVEIIKTLEDRYDQIKTHAAVRLEKANLELEGIRKQHESETLKLRAMLRKEELKSSSLAEMIEQKTKENKELTKILDEVIARVDPGADT